MIDYMLLITFRFLFHLLSHLRLIDCLDVSLCLEIENNMTENEKKRKKTEIRIWRKEKKRKETLFLKLFLEIGSRNSSFCQNSD